MAVLTEDGLVIETVPLIREAIQQALWVVFGTSLDLGDETIEGQFIGIMADRLGILWELAELSNGTLDPDAATGAQLDAICALTGTRRDGAEPSTVPLVLTGDSATVVPAESQVSVVGTGTKFQTDEDVTLVLVTQWSAGAASYSLGTRRYNSENRVYQVIVAGSGGVSEPTGTTTDTDNAVTWQYLGDGHSAADVDASAVDYEEFVAVAVAGDITEIETPVSGWSSVINLTDATPGQIEESDESLRIKREEELSQAGTGPVAAIRAALLEIDGVDSVTVFNNPTDATVDGMSPHSIEALVSGDFEPQDIWDALFANVAGGIQTIGDEDGIVEDSEGTEHTMRYSVPDEIEIYVDIVLTYDADLYPLDGDNQVKLAITALNESLQRTGKDAVASRISAACFVVPGVLNVSVVEIDDAPSPTTSTTVAIGLRERAIYDTSRITVASTPATP